MSPSEMVFVLVKFEYGAVKIDAVTPDEKIAENWGDEKDQMAVSVPMRTYHPRK